MLYRKLTIIFFAAILVGACGASVLQPKTGPGTSYPCGVNGVSCPGHMCCGEEDVCGSTGFGACPEGMCCYAGPDDTLSARPPHPQVPEHK
jgi:hypothetical protein